jgi:hypothetical protein
MARNVLAQITATICSHNDVIFDTDTDSTIFRSEELIIWLDVEAWLNGENHSFAELCIEVILFACMGTVVDIEAEVVADSMKSPTTMETDLRLH